MASYKACVTKYCKECIYDDTQPGSWRKQVELCTSTQCPLYEVRPTTMKTQEAKRKPRAAKIPVKVVTA